MVESDKKVKLPLVVAAPLSTQVKVVLIVVSLLGGLGMTFGAVSVGLLLGTPPVTNNNNQTYNAYNYTYPTWQYNYTTSNTYFNTTYIFNNATGQRTLINCCFFEIVKPLVQNEQVYFFNLSLTHRTVLDSILIKSECSDIIDTIWLRYNISVAGDSDYFNTDVFKANMAPQQWYLGNRYVLPNGTDVFCQFYLTHGDSAPPSPVALEIFIGYTVYL